MKPFKVMAALLATAILCIGFVSCSKEPDEQQPTFKFDYNPVITNDQGEEIEPQTTTATTAVSENSEPVTEDEPIKNEPVEETTTSKPTTAKPTTTRKPYTFPTRATTTAEPSTARTTLPTTQPTTKPTTTAKPTTTRGVEIPTAPPTVPTEPQQNVGQNDNEVAALMEN